MIRLPQQAHDTMLGKESPRAAPVALILIVRVFRVIISVILDEMITADATFDHEKTRFGRRVRYLRLKAGLSQEDLADACGLDRTYIGGIERGERNPSLKNILKLASTLQITLPELFHDTRDAGND